MSQAPSVPRVVVVVYDRFSPFHISVPCIVFGNYLPPDRHLFQLTMCAGESGPLTSTEGLSFTAEAGLEALRDADIVIVPGWRSPPDPPSEALLAALRQAYQRGATVVGLCLGTYVLAYAGLLDGKRAGTHWECERDFTQRFPAVQLDCNALYVEDGRLVTSAGTAAGLDCCLHLVRQHHGSQIANKLARRLVIPPYREGGQAQYIEQPLPATTQDSRINRLLDHLRQHLRQDFSLDALAQHTHMSRRTFTRHFHKATGMSVGDWLLAERLKRSQELLEATDTPIDHIADRVGFASAAILRQQFKKAFGVAPRDWRRTFLGR
ncbi:MAG: helix-turn-helix domain-containing protein [Paludibacterium sp.]|uniref:GlxA family transcriptional regulator n=1 Tax=Paludibacterium sp. TaxID=1917523 RepID=UPI0025DD96A9|nr:helix-turn-helix domain-containing protein [Paludibacterium sp.]MBV8048427.1 helix-turn-helix domain-containing protein [Paludibacterium sp.]MBV8647032.1 helix-turn-helix domain-containing protein [Paludibacterium sp.]